MNTSDLFATVLIIFIYMVLLLFTIILIGIENKKKNWNQYRCNQIVIPFADVFGEDVNDNFNYCVQGIQAEYMKELTEPLYSYMSQIVSMSGDLQNNMSETFAFVDNLRESIDFLTLDIFSVFKNLMVEVENTVLNVNDMFGKTGGTISTLINMVSTLQNIMVSGYKKVKPILKGVEKLAGV